MLTLTTFVICCGVRVQMSLPIPSAITVSVVSVRLSQQTGWVDCRTVEFEHVHRKRKHLAQKSAKLRLLRRAPANLTMAATAHRSAHWYSPRVQQLDTLSAINARAMAPLTAVAMGATWLLSRMGSLHRVDVAFFAASPSMMVQLPSTQVWTLPINVWSAQIHWASAGLQAESLRYVVKQLLCDI